MASSNAVLVQHQLLADVLAAGGCCQFQVSGGSMLPTLWPGDTVLIERRSPEQLEIGDIVLYEREGRFFLHRLVSLSSENLIARGDALPQEDVPVSVDCLRGVLGGVRRGGEWIMVPQKMSALCRVTAAALRRSSLATRLLIRAGMKIRELRRGEQIPQGWKPFGMTKQD